MAQYSKPPEMKIDAKKEYFINMETTQGKIRIQLFPKSAPLTVNNFVFLAREGYYDGVSFHRVIPGFMAQGGDPTGTGRGGPGYQFADEVNPKTNPLKHASGALSMANAGPSTNGSQFFIVYDPQPHLDGKHTVFGQVLSGMEAARKLQVGDKMTKVTVEEK